MLRARSTRKYKEINIHAFVRTFKKKQKYSEITEHAKIWTGKTCELIEIDRSGINGQDNKYDGLSKLRLRNELLLVK